MKRPLLAPILCFLLGILASGLSGANQLSSNILPFIGVLFLIFLLTLALKGKERFFYISLFILFFLLGAFRYTASVSPQKNDVSMYLDASASPAVFYGTVESDTEKKGTSYYERVSFNLRSKKLVINNEEHAVTGVVRVSIFSPHGKIPEVGDNIVVSGEISTPKEALNPGEFDYAKVMLRSGIRAQLFSGEEDHFFISGVEKTPVVLFRRLISSLRRKTSLVLDEYTEGATRALTESVVLGIRGSVPDEVKEVFMKTGTMHILAVSGLHVGIVAAVILILLKLVRVPRRISFVLAIVGIISFAAFTGSRPSSMRAAIMGSFVLLGLFMGRKSDLVNSLALSALLITFFRPGQLFDAGFILSYLAVLSIIYVTPLADSFLGIVRPDREAGKLERVRFYLLKSVSVSIAVWLGMMPVTAFYFKIITPSVVVANLIAVPLLFLIIISGFLLVLSGSLIFLSLFSKFTAIFLGYTVLFLVKSMEGISSFPLSFVKIASPDLIVMVLYYGALFTIIFISRKRASRVLFLIFLLLASNLFVWSEVLIKGPEETRITFFATGKSDAAVIEMADRSVLMVDAGTSGKKYGLKTGEKIIGPYLREKGIRKIDAVIMTHAHEDHIGGFLHILNNFKTGTVIGGGGETSGQDGEIYSDIFRLIKKKNINYLAVQKGDRIDGFPLRTLDVVNPPSLNYYKNPNNDSLVIKLVTPEANSIMFCADITSKVMKDILLFGSFLKSSIIKVPHHGSGLGDGAVVAIFLRAVNSEYAVITNRDFGDLDKSVIKTLDLLDSGIYLTGEEGSVTVRDTPKGFIVGTFRR